MTVKETGPATDWREIDRWDGGVGWIAHPEEGMERASHALAVDGDVWVVDPVDAPGLDDLLAEFGSVAGVVVLLDRHTRDAAAVARRHDVAVHLPAWLGGVADDVDAPVRILDDDLGDTGYEVHRVLDVPGWHEAALYDPDDGVLVVPEALGTAEFSRTGAERVGVHPVLRLVPPRVLRQFAPERVLVGHGEGVHEDAGAALTHALDGARRRAPSLYVETLREWLPV